MSFLVMNTSRVACDDLQHRDHRRTLASSALILIGCQPRMLTSVALVNQRKQVSSRVSVAKPAQLYAPPMVLSTVHVKTGNTPTIPQLADVLPGVQALGSTATEAWVQLRMNRG